MLPRGSHKAQGSAPPRGIILSKLNSAEAEKPCSSAPNRPAFLERTSKSMDRKWTNNKLTWRGLLRRKYSRTRRKSDRVRRGQKRTLSRGQKEVRGEPVAAAGV